MKTLNLTSDDYVEQPDSKNLYKMPSISMNDVDFSNCNEVNIDLIIQSVTYHQLIFFNNFF